MVYLTVPAVDGPAPPFKAKGARDADEVDVSLAALHGKWVVLLWYAKDFDPRTAQELAAHAARAAAFDKANAALVAASVDTVDTHLAWLAATDALRSPALTLLADHDHTVADAFGVYDRSAGAAHSATVIISPGGRIHHFALYSAGAHRAPSETLRLLGSPEA